VCALLLCCGVSVAHSLTTDEVQSGSVKVPIRAGFVSDTSIVIDLPNAARPSALIALSSQFGSAILSQRVTLSELSSAKANEQLSKRRLILALGSQACVHAAEFAPSKVVVCALIYRQSFNALVCPNECPGVHAIFMDQPLVRQARLAQLLYPELQDIAVLRSSTSSEYAYEQSSLVSHVEYSSVLPISRQVSDALQESDALLAVADSHLYNRDSLRSILLTAYGGDKPLIGFGHTYVRAGALLSAYSTPAHILNQADALLSNLSQSLESAKSASTVHAPLQFSVAINASVARSLGFSQRRRFAESQTLSDEDLEP